MAERDADRPEKVGWLRRLASPKLLWQATKLPWYVWVGAAAVGLLAVYVLFQKLIVYAVIVAAVFFGSKMAIDWVGGRSAKKKKAAAAAAAAEALGVGRDWKKELGL